jgi:hypothetical protein
MMDRTPVDVDQSSRYLMTSTTDAPFRSSPPWMSEVGDRPATSSASQKSAGYLGVRASAHKNGDVASPTAAPSFPAPYV